MRKELLSPKAVTVLPAGDNLQIIFALQDSKIFDVVLPPNMVEFLAHEIAAYLQRRAAA